jgi:hypothetical protein
MQKINIQFSLYSYTDRSLFCKVLTIEDIKKLTQEVLVHICTLQEIGSRHHGPCDGRNIYHA